MSRLQELARPAPAGDREERCDLCAAPIGPEHRHVLDVEQRRLLCACRPCSILFDSPAAGAGGGHYKLLPRDSRSVEGFRLDDALWQSFRIPVDLAFFFHSTSAGRVVAFYPGALGPVESQLGLQAWNELVARNPVLTGLEPDVEALLVNRTSGAREHWLAPVDRCYELVGIIRTTWRGLAGGEEVWARVGAFLDDLRSRAKTVTNGEEMT
jgi:Family of unknown function (DUF5947)